MPQGPQKRAEAGGVGPGSASGIGESRGRVTLLLTVGACLAAAATVGKAVVSFRAGGGGWEGAGARASGRSSDLILSFVVLPTGFCEWGVVGPSILHRQHGGGQ